LVSIGTLLMRADASVAIGTGHVMRCLALAQAWQDAGGQVVFAMAESTSAILGRLHAEGYEICTISASPGTTEDLAQTVALAMQRGCEWIVVDGYLFRADYQRGLKAADIRFLFIDDYGHSEHYVADLILNQNVSASPTLYPRREPHTQLLLGTRYAILRREFAIWKHWKRTIHPTCRRVLVTMGGADEENVTATIMEAVHLLAMRELEATVVVGGSNPHLAELRGQAERMGPRMKLLDSVSKFGNLMAESDLAVSAAGSTCWELCFMSLPSLLIDVADNQTAIAKELHRRECAIHIGNRKIAAEAIAERLTSLIEAQEVRQSLSRRARELVDGMGATRVVSFLRGRKTLRLRPVQDQDRHLLWEWANDAEVRASSFSSEPISWETHDTWFNGKLRASEKAGSGTRIFIAEDDGGRAVGQIRFDCLPDGDWEVGVSLDRAMRGHGLGTEIVAAGVREILKETPMARIHAHVKTRNLASAKSFERADFNRVGMDRIRGVDAIHLIY
jgi:UDP-2,4-diacetamido-2,4,6-trideoxy-beta-L-altropyranose hydrolase